MCELLREITLNLLVLTCFVPNLEEGANKLGYEWQLPKNQSHYNAITLSLHKDDIRVMRLGSGETDTLTHIMLFRPPVDVTVIAHELAHVITTPYHDHWDNEQAVTFLSESNTFIIYFCNQYKIPLYYRVPNFETNKYDTNWINYDKKIYSNTP
jgi:hypothetical protein